VHFTLIDTVLERSDDRLVACKLVSAAEEYLQDHFPSFPVLPGVLMLEAMVQAARELVQGEGGGEADDVPLVLGGVRTLKYGQFVRPGCTLRVEVQVVKRVSGGEEDGKWGGAIEFKGKGVCLDPRADSESVPPTAVSGRFTLRPLRLT
jgi:3-hydroxyacyl-[acyl-carrier-protein] dehydratase